MMKVTILNDVRTTAKDYEYLRYASLGDEE